MSFKPEAMEEVMDTIFVFTVKPLSSLKMRVLRIHLQGSLLEREYNDSSGF